MTTSTMTIRPYTPLAVLLKRVSCGRTCYAVISFVVFRTQYYFFFLIIIIISFICVGDRLFCRRPQCCRPTAVEMSPATASPAFPRKKSGLQPWQSCARHVAGCDYCVQSATAIISWNFNFFGNMNIIFNGSIN